jgi:hypothetical protein
MCEPRKPLAPVRRTFCGIVFLGWILRGGVEIWRFWFRSNLDYGCEN